MFEMNQIKENLSFLGYHGPNILLAFIVVGLYYQNMSSPYPYAFVFAWQIISHYINVIIKNTLQAPRPESKNDPEFPYLKPTMSNYLTIHEKYGMPSGHLQCTVSELTFIILYFKNPVMIGAAVCQALLTGWQRYSSKKHSLKQIIAGSLIGGLIGSLFYNIYTNLPEYYMK